MKNNSLGFTLIEVILALAILGTIGVVTINLLSGQIAIRQRILDLNRDLHGLDATLKRISKDLEGAYIPDYANAASLNLSERELLPQFYYKNSGLVFFTMSYHSYSSGSNESNQAFVYYHLRDDPVDKNKKQLIRSVDTDLVTNIETEGIGKSEILLEDVKTFELEFWDGNRFRKDWHSLYNDTLHKLPKLVKIHLSSFATENKLTKGDAPKKSYNLDTTVYLENTQGQKETIPPSWPEFKWE